MPIHRVRSKALGGMMSSYDMEDLVQPGMAPVARLLITRARKFQTATYGEAGRMLEGQLGIDRIFSTHPGNVVGNLMTLLWSHDDSLPPLNVLMVNRGGTPGTGADWYISQWSGRRYSKMSEDNRAPILPDAMRAVWSYKDWEIAYEDAFGASFSPIPEAAPAT